MTYYDPQGKPITQDEWIKRFQGDRIVSQTEVGDFWVSTVYLGTDHNFASPGNPPFIFETMIFEKESDAEQMWRYATVEEAIEGHRRAVNSLRDALGRMK